MGTFELIERDGLARIGRLETPHGPLETPALLPVVHPDPERQSITAAEIRSRYGLPAVITSAYITYRTPRLRARAEESGIHGLLRFDGPVMTDSGAFQQHAYGHVEVSDEEIFSFQRRIGSDIATVLDIFVEPDAAEPLARRGVETTLERARRARATTHGLLAVPVQGGTYPDLRYESARGASEIGDVLAVGGVVPLMEQYRFVELARVLHAARPALAPECVVHLFGTGHPMTFAFAALFGVDLVDSSAYHKFARRGALLFPEGTIAIEGLRESTCACRLCGERPLADVARLPAAEKERAIARHNLLQCATEMAVVRQAIRDGALWELAERRATAHPAMLAGMRAVVRGVRTFLPTEPESRRSFRVVGSTSGLRPSVIRFLADVQRWKGGRRSPLLHPWVPLQPRFLDRTATIDRSGTRIEWDCLTPVGPVPLELTELYPIGPMVTLEEFEPEAGARRSHTLVAPPDLEQVEAETDRSWGDDWVGRHAEAVLGWRYGTEAAASLLGRPLLPERSPRSGRLRAMSHQGTRWFVVGPDGVPHPTWVGAGKLHDVLPSPASRIVVADDAVPFVAEGRSLFSAFVAGGDSSLRVGASALLVDAGDHLLAVGRLVLAPAEMGRMKRGVAVRVTAHARSAALDPTPELPDDGGARRVEEPRDPRTDSL